MIDRQTLCRREQMIRRAVLEVLEARMLAHAGLDGDDDDHDVEPPIPYHDLAIFAQPNFQISHHAGVPLSSVPQLSSNTGAHAKLYLDFVGAAAQHWGGYSTTATHAFTLDTDATTFTSTETSAITEIWRRVAEKYSPFNLDVTTVDPGTYTDGNAMRVVVGGDASWYGGGAGGVSYVGAFASMGSFDLNTAYVFSDLFGTNYKAIGEAIAHESGHAFGLQHQSSFDPTSHAKTSEYNQGDSAVAPIMGVSYYSSRGLWSNGPNTYGYNSFQDDMSIIAGGSNGFGYRADDYGNDVATARSLTRSGTSLSLPGGGVIERTTDADYFSFSTAGGAVSLSVNVASYGAMLDSKLVLMTADGTVLNTADTGALGATIDTTLAAGSYRVAVMSHGNYGDVGQYSLSGTAPAADAPAAPTDLLTTATPGGAVSLSWTDQSSNETGFKVQRSTDGGVTWLTVTTTAAGATGYVDESASAGNSYAYRVMAMNDNVPSAATDPSWITLKPASPTGLTAVASGTTISLHWLDVTGETAYRVERCDSGTDAWVWLGTASADQIDYSDSGLATDTAYYYRIVATNGGGESDASSPATAVTDETADPNPPGDNSNDSGNDINNNNIVGDNTDDDSDQDNTSNLQEPTDVTANGRGKYVSVTWTDNSDNETGFRVERSTDDGDTWQFVKFVDRNKTNYKDKSIGLGRTYTYRVVSVNLTEMSESDESDDVTIAPAAPNGLHAHAFAGGVSITWNDVTGEDGYQVERSGGSSKGWTVLAYLDQDETSFTDTTVIGRKKYKYRIRATNDGGETVSKKAAKVKAVGASTAPSAPPAIHHLSDDFLAGHVVFFTPTLFAAYADDLHQNLSEVRFDS